MTRMPTGRDPKYSKLNLKVSTTKIIWGERGGSDENDVSSYMKSIISFQTRSLTMDTAVKVGFSQLTT